MPGDEIVYARCGSCPFFVRTGETNDGVCSKGVSLKGHGIVNTWFGCIMHPRNEEDKGTPFTTRAQEYYRGKTRY